MRKDVSLTTIVSDHDGKTYVIPDIRGRLNIQYEEVKPLLDQEFSQNPCGLKSLHFAPKILESECIKKYAPFAGLEWQKSQLVLKSLWKDPYEKIRFGVFEPHVIIEKFSIHYPTGELVMSTECGGLHADHIARYGTHPYQEYLRLAYRSGTLLSRAYYCPQKPLDPYDAALDKKVNLWALTILITNKLPAETEIILSAERDYFLLKGFR